MEVLLSWLLHFSIADDKRLWGFIKHANVCCKWCSMCVSGVLCSHLTHKT